MKNNENTDQPMIEEIFHIVKDVHTSVKKLEVDVETLKIDINGLKSDVSGLKEDVSGLKQDVSGLKSDVSGLKQDVSDLKIGQFQHSIAILELKEDVQKIDTRLIRTEQRVDDIYTFTERIAKKITDHDDEITANHGLYQQHEKRLTTIEGHLRIA